MIKNDLGSLRRLVSELKPYKRPLLLGIVCMLVVGPASVIPNLIWMYVVDVVILKEQYQNLIPALLFGVLMIAISLLGGVWRDRFWERAGQSFIYDLRRRLYAKLMRQSPGYLGRQRTGDLQSRVISDVDAIQTSLIGGFSALFSELYSFILVMLAVIWINPLIGGTVFVPLFLGFLVARHYNPRLREIYRETRTALGETGAHLQETLGGFAVIKAFDREKQESGAFDERNREVYNRAMKGTWLRTRVMPIIFSFAYITNLIMLGLGAWLVIKGHFTLGGLVALRGFWWQLNSPVQTFARVNDMVQRALASSHRVYQVLDTPEDIRDPAKPEALKNIRQPLVFDHVGFAYDPERPVLHDINLTVAPGEIIGLAGSSGAGKSTIIQLILRFYDPGSGTIRIGDQPLHSLRQSDWRSHLGTVPQETFLFHTSVLENIRFGRPDATLEEVRQAAARANADRFIQHLPKGYDTLVGERGIKLSGGQRQRIGVARALLANPEILLLDEPTSAVEPESEKIIQDSLLELMKGRTVVLSSHRPSLLQCADRVYFLREGRIEEIGSHLELMAQRKGYFEMVRHWEWEPPADEELAHLREKSTPSDSD